jgi:hypothetical protein
VFTRVNRPHTHTLYPPADEVTFLSAHAVAGDGMVPWKLSMLTLEAAAVALLLVLLSRARVSGGRVVLYAWHPIAIVEIAGSGHPDPIMLVPLLATLLLWDAHRRVAAGVALGVAALAKFVPLLAAPFLARRLGGRFLLAGAATATALYLPYVGAGTDTLGSVSSFVYQTTGSGGAHRRAGRAARGARRGGRVGGGASAPQPRRRMPPHGAAPGRRAAGQPHGAPLVPALGAAAAVRGAGAGAAVDVRERPGALPRDAARPHPPLRRRDGDRVGPDARAAGARRYPVVVPPPFEGGGAGAGEDWGAGAGAGAWLAAAASAFTFALAAFTAFC